MAAAPMTVKEREEAGRLYLKGMSIREVAAHMERSYGSIYWNLNKAGIVRRPARRPRKHTDATS